MGDSPDSYAYDGKRIKKWNVGANKYGEPWVPGDVIGCCIDLDVGLVMYTRNGRSLGVAFEQIRRGRGLAYYPAVSLSRYERCRVNFGDRPLAYPQDSYAPLQTAPVAQVVNNNNDHEI